MKATFASIVYDREEVTIYYYRGDENERPTITLTKFQFRDTLKQLYPGDYNYAMNRGYHKGVQDTEGHFHPEYLKEDYHDDDFNEIMQGILDDVLGVG